MNTEKSTILQQNLDLKNLNWSNINWKNIEEYVMKLQQQIFLAELNKQQRKVKQLQRRLIHSKANLLLAIKNNTLTKRSAADTDNCQVTDKDRINLYNELINYNFHHIKPLNLKNNHINSLAIIKDHIIQTIIKSALEPQCEVYFESNSYGGRPGRNIYDAIGSIYNKTGVNKKRKWIVNLVLDTSICNIDYLIRQINNFAYKDTIRKWLTAGYLNDYNNVQKYIIVPLLVNILLHGIEDFYNIKYRKSGVQISSGPSVVRYLNKLVIFCISENEANNILDQLNQYLNLRGIRISSQQIVHITTGFDFLGFNIRLYQAHKNNAVKQKLLIKPSKDSIKSVINRLKIIFDKYKGYPVRKLIQLTNSIVLSTAYHWRTVVASPAFKYIDYYLDYKFYHHIKRLHPRKSWTWLKQQYYRKNKNNSIAKHICDPKDSSIVRMYCRDVPIKRYVLVTFKNSPYDPRLKEYWDKHYRYIFHVFHGEARIKMAMRQKFLCPHCFRHLYNYSVGGTFIDELLEMNHIIPTKFNGKTVYSNIQLMHASCHIEHHKRYKSLDDFIQYQKQQQEWYDSLWEKLDNYECSNRLEKFK